MRSTGQRVDFGLTINPCVRSASATYAVMRANSAESGPFGRKSSI